MKQLMGTNRKYFLSETDADGLRPTVELIIATTEPTYKLGQGYGMVKEWTSENFRFSMTKKSLAMFIETLDEIKADLDKMDAPEKTPVKKQKTLFETPEKKADE